MSHLPDLLEAQNADLHTDTPLSDLFMHDVWGNPINGTGDRVRYGPSL